jgi:hypothetical protein
MNEEQSFLFVDSPLDCYWSRLAALLVNHSSLERVL